MNEGKSRVDSFLPLVGQELHLVAFVCKGCFEEREMNRCHFRGQDSMSFLVFLCKNSLMIRIRLGVFYSSRFAVIHDEQQGTQANTNGSEIGTLVDF